MKLPRRQFLHLAAGTAALPAVSRIAWAQAYPSRPVRLIVGFAAGGGADITARLMGQYLSERLGQQFIVENRPGAGGNIATEAVVNAPADGYTLLLATSPNAVNASLYQKLNFNFIRDISPVASVVAVPLVVVIHPSVPAKTVPEFIAYARANPGKLNMASGGVGAAQHVAGELFKMMTGVNMVHVPYRGGAPAVADLLGGQIKKCEISLCHSDLSLPISRRANTGAMRLANLRPNRRWKAGRYPESRAATQTSTIRRPAGADRYNIPGSVAISLGPAEEQLISRPYLVRAGLFKDSDIAILLHIGNNFSAAYGLTTYAAISAKFTFHGKSAHGAMNPWDGKDAVDAAELMDIGFDKLREHLRPTYRGHRAITAGGIQPNIIPDYGQIWWFVRDANMEVTKETFDKLVKIAEGASLMTGTTYEYQIDAAAWPQLGLKSIAQVLQRNIDAVGMPKWSDDEKDFARRFQTAMGAKPIGLNTSVTPLGAQPQVAASDDKGDVSWVVPSAALNFPASVPGINYHNWQAAVTPTSTIAHKGMVAGSKVLAGAILDFLTKPELVREARAEFEKATAELKYFDVLPADAKPPLNLNKETMDRYRAEMSRFYVNKPVQFQ